MRSVNGSQPLRALRPSASRLLSFTSLPGSTSLPGFTSLPATNLSIATRVRASHTELIKSKPVKPGFELSMFSDSGVIGDMKTTMERVTLVGKTSARATVSLALHGRALHGRALHGKRLQTIADTEGSFLFDNIPLKLGKNTVETIAQDSAQPQIASASFRLTIRRVGSDPTIDPVIAWNAIALKAALSDGTPAPAIARNLAIVHTSVYDAVNAIEGKNQRRLNLAVPVGASAASAAIGAAYEALISLYPQKKVTFDAALTDSLALISDGSAKTEGVNFGKLVADAIVSSRQNDGASTLGAAIGSTYRPGKAAGEWRPTPPNFRDAFLPYWGNVLPFTLASAQFRPGLPPDLKSRKYARELQQVKRLGALDSPIRTDDQTTIAQFWSGIGGPVYWNQLTEQIADRQKESLLDNARLFARLNLAEADAGITAWNTKYTYNRWRPIDAIRKANGSLLKERDRQWTPLLNTPSHPDYISAHSIFSNAAAVILARSFNQPIKFTVSSSSLPGVRRTYSSFEAAAQEAGISRIYGGIHTATANRTGLQVGRSLGNYVFNFL